MICKVFCRIRIDLKALTEKFSGPSGRKKNGAYVAPLLFYKFKMSSPPIGSYAPSLTLSCGLSTAAAWVAWAVH